MEFKPGEKYIYNGLLPIGEEVTVVAWEPDKWYREGCRGNFRKRRGLVPVFSEKFPETRFWWVLPSQLKKKSVMRLLPMDEAPRDGSKIIVKERNEYGNWYRLCWWVKPYSTHSRCGAWRHYCDGNAISEITEQRALGWMPEPESP